MKILALWTVLTLAATPVLAAGGLDLSINGCPGNEGALGGAVSVDCASGNGILVLATWAPAEPIPDLVALDGLLDLYVPDGLEKAPFWDVDLTGCNAGALNISQARPAKGCASPAYTAAWAAPNSGAAIAAFYPDTVRRNSIRLSFTCYSSSKMAVKAGQKMFGFQIFVDGTNAAEAGGECKGCTQPFALIWNHATPGSAASNKTTVLSESTGSVRGFSNCLGFNGQSDCSAIPSAKSTWRQVKSLQK